MTSDPKPIQRIYDDGSDPDNLSYQQMPQPKQPAAAPRNERVDEILVGLFRWIAYSMFMLVLLIPFLERWQLATGAMLLGHISAQLNALINKTENAKK